MIGGVGTLLLVALLQRGAATLPPPPPRSHDDSVAEQIRARVEDDAALVTFYARRSFRAAWSGEQGPNRLADELLDALGRADLEGLDPEDYRAALIRGALDTVRADAANGRAISPARLAELDVLLSDAFLLYASHLLRGRVDPETLHPTWDAARRGADLATILQDALESRKIARALQRLIPTDDGYLRLRAALARERAIAAHGGWPADLSERLRLEGDLKDGDSLTVGIQRFQQRHGLPETGVLDSATQAELSVSAADRVEQLRINLERWRWLPQDLGRRHVIVNIAAQLLEVVEDGEVVMRMRVVVGREYKRTPVFSDTVRYIVLNPSWHVPASIAVEEIIPRIRQDSTYLERFGMHLLAPDDAVEVDPRTVDWSKVTADNFPYRLRQDPGRLNSLGRMKFVFPNRYDIYLHDTPARNLFSQPQRDFSHGCIRIERPLDLAAYLMKKTRWDRRSIQSALDDGTERTMYLARPTPIHLLYWTAWADADGTIQFRPDINDLDPPLVDALAAPLRATEEATRNQP
ncbi:MAG TPA: L,D-transpeptidase family protein [Gemmatimonadales bacterium]|nr:L,D-transpeptidase family protein [Gemmatimonadales bacterium]